MAWGNRMKKDEESSDGIAFTETTLKDAEKGTPPSPDASLEAGHVGLQKQRDPFGGNAQDAEMYKTMAWWQAGMVMIAETISLGILSLPSALAMLGFVPGVIIIVGLGILATYTGYVLGQFKQMYPFVHSMADAGQVLMGPVGREILGIGQVLFYIFIMGSHILTFNIMMNTITDHGTCTVVFAVVALVLSFLCTLPRTLKSVAYMSITSFISVGSAVIVTMVGVSITKPGMGHILYTNDPDFVHGFLAVCNIAFAYAGHVAFFGFISELKNARDYPKALCLLQVADVSMYTVAAIVIYWYAGEKVASPALDSSSPLTRKIAYGLAIPTIVISGVVNGHVASKFLFVRVFRKTDEMGKKNFKSYGTWAFIAFSFWIIAFIIAETIPVFNDMLGITGALFASWFTYGLAGVFWLHMNWGKWMSSWRKILLMVLNVMNVIIGLIICVAGLYASAKSMSQNAAAAGHGSVAFSCKDNSWASSHKETGMAPK